VRAFLNAIGIIVVKVRRVPKNIKNFFGRISLLHIQKLKLRYFRNYKDLGIEFGEGYNIIYGDNAQGKTNIIEAIFLCASGRSHRTSRDLELVNTGSIGYYVKLDMFKNDADSSIEMIFEKNERKKIKINEIPAIKIGSLMGHLNAVIFSPEDLFIIKEGPSERRRFLDITLSQLRPSYFHDLQQYSKILLQRNMLLKEMVNRKELYDTLEIWNNHLIKTGSRIIKIRNEFIQRMDMKASMRHKKLSNEAEKLEVRYVPSFNVKNSYELNDIEEDYRKTVESAIKKEIYKCTTLFGPHRDDYDIILNGMSTKIYGSQGQQRTAVLSMKLAEIDIMKEDTGDCPVLLLDDVLSELDNNRQEYLFENIGKIQTFITCTDKSFFRKPDANAKLFNIVNGMVIN